MSSVGARSAGSKGAPGCPRGRRAHNPHNPTSGQGFDEPAGSEQTARGEHGGRQDRQDRFDQGQGQAPPDRDGTSVGTARR